MFCRKILCGKQTATVGFYLKVLKRMVGGRYRLRNQDPCSHQIPGSIITVSCISFTLRYTAARARVEFGTINNVGVVSTSAVELARADRSDHKYNCFYLKYRDTTIPVDRRHGVITNGQ